MKSRYLPENFESNPSVALISGKGHYPFIMAQNMQTQGVRVTLVELEGETDQATKDLFGAEAIDSVKVGQVGKLLKILKKQGVHHAIMAGQVTPGKLFKGMHPDLKALWMLTKLRRRNAETLFGAIANEIEKIGVHLLDARAFMDKSIVEPGTICGKVKISQDIIDHGIEITRAVAKLDIGQGAVVSRGTVLAVEGYEGTDKLLRRCKEFEAKEKVFIKTAKPGQDYRFDVPVFGINTVEAMHEGGIDYAVLEAGSTLILDQDSVIARMQELGMTLIGYGNL